MLVVSLIDCLLVDMEHDDIGKRHFHKDDECVVNLTKVQLHWLIWLLNSMLMNMNRSIFLCVDDGLRDHR